MLVINISRRVYQQNFQRLSCRTLSNFTLFNENQNFIGGERCKPLTSSITIPNINPATAETVGEFGMSNQEDVNKAVQCAVDAYETWRETTSSDRCAILRKAANILEDNKRDIAVMETVDSGLDPFILFFIFYCGLGIYIIMYIIY